MKTALENKSIATFAPIQKVLELIENLAKMGKFSYHAYSSLRVFKDDTNEVVLTLRYDNNIKFPFGADKLLTSLGYRIEYIPALEGEDTEENREKLLNIYNLRRTLKKDSLPTDQVAIVHWD